jgi:hypothetical protein
MHRHPVLKDVTIVSPIGDRSSAGFEEAYFGHGVANLSRGYQHPGGRGGHRVKRNRSVALGSRKVGFWVTRPARGTGRKLPESRFRSTLQVTASEASVLQLLAAVADAVEALAR